MFFQVWFSLIDINMTKMSLLSILTSLEEAYEALRSFEILGIDKKPDIKSITCHSVVETLGSSSSSPKDLFHALRVNGILKCEFKEELFEVFLNRLALMYC